MSTYLENKKEDLDFFKRDIATLRTGRANPASLDHIQVEAYGVMNPLNAVGNISVADARCMIIAPWDKGVSKAIEKAVVEADLGFGVVNEGDKIRLTIPALTEENRRDLVKKLNERMEKARISVRGIREDVKAEIEKADADKEISEDEKFRFIKEMDEFTTKVNEELKEIRDHKEAEIMTI